MQKIPEEQVTDGIDTTITIDRLRHDLAKPVNIRYIFKDHIYYPDNIVNTALSDFFEHNCDSSFSASQISKAFKLYYELTDRKQLNELFKDNRVKEFLQFVNNSIKHNLNWEFC